jgi:hypothetical protein
MTPRVANTSSTVRTESQQYYDKFRAQNPNRAFYWSAEWRKFAAAHRACNPQCQFLDTTGKRCQKQSQAVHHLRDPRDAPELRVSWSNTVGVCMEHHQGGQRGETQAYRYAPTKDPFNATYEHEQQPAVPRKPVAPNALVNGRVVTSDLSGVTAEPCEMDTAYLLSLLKKSKPVA